MGGIIRIGAPSTPDAVSGAALAKLHVDYGDDVTAGQLLAEIDTGAIVRARLAEARADLETARREAVAAASLADEACVLSDVAARQSRRKTELLGRGLASTEEAERAKGDAEASAASCAARRAAARVAESAIASGEARVARYQAEIERSFIRAPFAGRVLDVLSRPGEIVGPDGILELGRVGTMYAIAEVYETDVRNLRKGMRAMVSSGALGGSLGGTVERIRPKVQKMDEIGTDPAARKDARIVEVEIRLDDAAAAANLTNLQVDIEIGR
jgi:HlyD family secretion protein